MHGGIDEKEDGQTNRPSVLLRRSGRRAVLAGGHCRADRRHPQRPRQLDESLQFVGHVCDLFAGDLVAVYQGQPERNYDAICTLLSNSLRDREKSYHYSLDLKEILVSGDLGAVRLVWTLTVAREDGGVIETIDEPGIDVFRRQPDGVWKIARYLAFPIAPRP
jgi:steroid delta-isomerase